MSQSTSRTSALVMSVAPGKPWTVPCSAFQAMTRAMSRPSGLWMPPVESETATTVEPSSAMSRAAIEPALPKPWTATRRLVRSMPRWRAASTMRVDAAAGGRLVAALGAAEADRLAGDDARDRVARVHRVGVHHPGHDLGVGVDVRRRDVLLGTDQDLDLGGEAAGQALELLLAELLGIDDHAALAAAVRDADDRALPGHPHREGLDLVERDVLVVADAALGRAAAEVVLDAIAGEDLDRCRRPSGPGSGRSARGAARAGRGAGPGRGSRRSAARSNCCWATCQALIARSDVLGGHGMDDPHVSGGLGTAVGCGPSPGRPHGARRRSGDHRGWLARDCLWRPSIAAASPIRACPMVPGRQRCRNRAATSAPGGV